MTARTDRANAIRALAMDAVQAANSGHPGAPMGLADVAEVLWREALKHNPTDPQWFDRDRFVNHALTLRVVTHFDISHKRKILAKRMSDKTVIGENTAQIGMAFEYNAKQIESLAFKPVGGIPYFGNRGDLWKIVLQKSTNPNSVVMGYGE